MGKTIVTILMVTLIFFIGLLTANLYLIWRNPAIMGDTDINIPDKQIVEPIVIEKEVPIYLYEDRIVEKEVEVPDEDCEETMKDKDIYIQNLTRQLCDVQPDNAYCRIDINN